VAIVVGDRTTPRTANVAQLLRTTAGISTARATASGRQVATNPKMTAAVRRRRRRLFTRERAIGGTGVHISDANPTHFAISTFDNTPSAHGTKRRPIKRIDHAPSMHDRCIAGWQLIMACTQPSPDFCD